MILRDITESRRTAQQTIESERLNALRLLAAGVAHEIGNPLNSLHIHLQLMERSVQKLHERRFSKSYLRCPRPRQQPARDSLQEQSTSDPERLADARAMIHVSRASATESQGFVTT